MNNKSIDTGANRETENDRPSFTAAEARAIGASVGIDFEKVDIEQFRAGLAVEFEHGTSDPETNVTDDNVQMTAKIAWAHLKELPDYYTRLAIMEAGAGTNR